MSLALYLIFQEFPKEVFWQLLICFGFILLMTLNVSRLWSTCLMVVTKQFTENIWLELPMESDFQWKKCVILRFSSGTLPQLQYNYSINKEIAAHDHHRHKHKYILSEAYKITDHLVVLTTPDITALERFQHCATKYILNDWLQMSFNLSLILWGRWYHVLCSVSQRSYWFIPSFFICLL